MKLYIEINCINILIFSLILLIIYFINKRMIKENFQHNIVYYSNGERINQPSPKYLTFCDKDIPIPGYDSPNIVQNQPNMSANQRLVGPPNPKTFISPVVVPPIADLDYWKSNNLTVLSNINKESQKELFQNGYVSTSNCGNACDSLPLVGTYGEYTKRFSEYKPLHQRIPPKVENPKVENPKVENPKVEKIVENFLPEYGELIGENINISCGYNAKNLDVNLPSNSVASECEKDEIFSEFNKNLYTQNVGENMFDINQINEPINSLIGISLQQPFEPVTYHINKYGEKIFTEHDPNIFKQKKVITPLETVRTDNVYDPRSYGYGTSYRAYENELLGQPRFMYDDINAVRMPNYITRSNIDHNSFADTYGPMKEDQEFGNKYNSDIRRMANKAFIDDTTQFREEMSQRLMRKRNSELWQTRKYPKGPHQK